jgi:hypothetical protein
MVFLQKIKETTRKVNPEMQATWSTKHKTKTKQNTQHKKKKLLFVLEKQAENMEIT